MKDSRRGRREIDYGRNTSWGDGHRLPEDLAAMLRAHPKVAALWQGLTPLGRNEFVCWVEDARQAKTRGRRIVRTGEELLEGKRRPCCWAGCIHRTDKAPGKWQQAVLVEGKVKRRRSASAN